MDVIKTLQPGAHGTKCLQRHWQDKLVAVRYRKDKTTNTLYTTVEIIVDQRAANPTRRKPTPYFDFDIVRIKVHIEETQLRHKVKAAGGRWDMERKLWRITYGKAQHLGLVDRIIDNVSEY